MSTIKDIADLAGVSVATVSYVINDSRTVLPETKRKVLAAIQELNYVPNSAARGLRSNKNKTIGLIISDITNPFYPNLAKGCQDALKNSGYSLMMYNTDDQQNKISDVVRQVKEGKLDGIILSSLMYSDIDKVQELEKLDFPTVLVHRTLDEINLDSVVADNYSGSYLATEHLIGLGHKRIVFFQGVKDSPVAIDRQMGYFQAMKNWSLEPRVADGVGNYQSSFTSTIQLLNNKENYQPTAIVASSDIMAFGVIDAIKNLGLSVPGDISVIGFDDLFLSSWNSIQLTTVRVPIYDLGMQSAQLLLRKMNNNKSDSKIKKISLQTDLIIRKTCGTF